MSLPEVLRLAQAGSYTPPLQGRPVIRAAIAADPSPWSRNVVAALHAELEQILGLPLVVSGGGRGCIQMIFDIGDLAPDERRRIALLLVDAEMREYLFDRYGLGWLSVDNA